MFLLHIAKESEGGSGDVMRCSHFLLGQESISTANATYLSQIIVQSSAKSRFKMNTIYKVASEESLIPLCKLGSFPT